MAFVPEAALIALREGLEALLILGLLLGLATRFNSRPGKVAVWTGFAAGIAASLILGLLVQSFLGAAFEATGGPLFELLAATTAVVVLTYMVVWMGDHTRQLARSMTRRAERALQAGAPWVLGLLVGITTLREGLETVLFYAALIPDTSAGSVLLSGLAGFLASGAIAAVLFLAAVRVRIDRVFAWSGAFLVLVAAGLLIHVAHAAAELGWINHGTPLWDTSAAIPEDRADGRVLHALVGYTPNPTALQLFLYLGYVILGGGLFAIKARWLPSGNARKGLAAGAAAALLLTGGLAAADRGDEALHSHAATAGAQALVDAWPPYARVGILYRSHGEPVEYNATTYESFATFAREILELYGYGHLLLADQGTILMDRGAPFVSEPRPLPQLMDAWTSSFTGAAVPVPQPPTVPVLGSIADGSLYLAPGPGPGLGEPDVLEMAGLSAYREWLKMGGSSPMWHHERTVRDLTIQALRDRYGDRVVVAEAWHIAPAMRASESEADAIRALKAAGVTHVVDFYRSGVPSDVMDTCMMRPHVDHALEEAGFERVVHVVAPALEPAWAAGVAERVAAELATVPSEVPVAVFLTNHGSNPGRGNPCGDGPDRYHELARAAYQASEAAVQAAIAGRAAEARIYHVYAQGAGAGDDGILSPTEAFDDARGAGAQVIIDLPFEFVGDGFDTLVVLREAWGFEPGEHPYYGPGFETRFRRQGVNVWVLSGSFSSEAKAAAHIAVLEAGLQEAVAAGIDPESGHGHGP